jgi:hypothetical protein
MQFRWGIIQLILFVHAFYAFEFPLFYNHHNREDNVIVITFAMRTYQGDLLGRALFAIAHFKVLLFIISRFLFCLFPSITDDTNIINPPLIVSFAYEHFQIELHVMVFSSNLKNK